MTTTASLSVPDGRHSLKCSTIRKHASYVCGVCIFVGLLTEGLDKMRKKEEAVYLAEIGNGAVRLPSLLNKGHNTNGFKLLVFCSARGETTANCGLSVKGPHKDNTKNLAANRGSRLIKTCVVP